MQKQRKRKESVISVRHAFSESLFEMQVYWYAVISWFGHLIMMNMLVAFMYSCIAIEGAHGTETAKCIAWGSSRSACTMWWLGLWGQIFIHYVCWLVLVSQGLGLVWCMLLCFRCYEFGLHGRKLLLQDKNIYWIFTYKIFAEWLLGGVCPQGSL